MILFFHMWHVSVNAGEDASRDASQDKKLLSSSLPKLKTVAAVQV